jgi:phenylacetate-CoA ligase
MLSFDALYRRSPTWVQTLMLNAYATRLTRYRRGPAYNRVVKGLLESQFWPRARLQSYADERVRNIVRVAYENSSFYRQLMTNARLTPRDIQSTQDLVKLPVITNETVRNSGMRLLTAPSPLPDWSHGHTSGTTGSPLSLYYDRATCVINDAVDWRQKVWGGMEESDWIGVFLGRVIVAPQQRRPPFWRTNWVNRQVWFSSFHLNEENLGHYVREIERRRIRFLEGYPSTLFILAQYVVNRGISLPLDAVFCSSETLHQVQRDTIQIAFGCTPFDFYGHAERTIFATECENHEGKHVAEEYGYTEIVDEAGVAVGDGEFGYLTGTSLHNAAMPLIRYRTGDLSAIRREPCACGRTLMRIESVATKAEDIVVTPDGRMISPSILTHPFKPFPQIRKSQLIQTRLDHVLVKIVPSFEFTATHKQLLTSELATRLGPGIEIEIQMVDAIPNEPSGKFRWIISQVDHPTHFRWSA